MSLTPPRVIVLLALFLSGTALAGASEPVEINIGYYESVGGLGRHSQIMNEIIEKFMEANPNIKVTTTVAGYSQFYERLPVELATGLGPDVWLSDGVLVDQYSSQGFALDLTERVNRDIVTSEYFGIEDLRDPDGRVWAFPQGLQSSALFYNKSMFDTAGLNYPTDDWTYDDVRQSARRLTVRDAGGTTTQYGFRVINHISEGWFPVIKAFGGGALDATRQKSMFSDPNTIAGLEWLVGIIHNDLASPPLGTANRFNWFPTELVAMQTSLYTRVAGANQAEINYDVAPLPAGPGGRVNPVIVNSWIINSATSEAKQDAAWEWIKFFAGVEAQTMWAALDEAIPVNREVAVYSFMTSDKPPANRLAFVESLAFSAPLDINPVWNEWVSAATTALTPAFRGQESVTQAAQNADHAVQVILDDFYKNN